MPTYTHVYPYSCGDNTHGDVLQGANQHLNTTSSTVPASKYSCYGEIVFMAAGGVTLGLPTGKRHETGTTQGTQRAVPLHHRYRRRVAMQHPIRLLSAIIEVECGTLETGECHGSAYPDVKHHPIFCR